MTSPIAAVRALPRFAYLSPAEAREVVLAVLGAVRDLPMRAKEAQVVAAIEFNRPFYEKDVADDFRLATAVQIAVGDGRIHSAAHRAAIDALVAEVQEEG